MASPYKLTILGCGNSTGVPAAGNYWGSCDPSEPKNKRTRPSVYIRSDQCQLVIDTGADFSAQATRHDIQHLDGVLYTHSHGDHVNGIDDLRRYMMMQPDKILPIYSNNQTISELKRRFYYLFEDSPESIYKKSAQCVSLDTYYGSAYTIKDISFISFEQMHGEYVHSVGYRFGDLAYCTDLKELNYDALQILKGVKTLIIDSAGYKQTSNPVHANLDEIYGFNDIIQAETVYLTSLSLAMDYQTLISELPNGYKPAYDGLELEFSYND